MTTRRHIVNLLEADGDNSGIDTKPLTGEQKAGVKLAYLLLALILLAIIALLVCFYITDLDTSHKISLVLNDTVHLNDTLYNRRLDHVNLLIQEKKEYREFIVRNFQYIIGVLLPILTSILGYIFGSKAKD